MCIMLLVHRFSALSFTRSGALRTDADIWFLDRYMHELMFPTPLISVRFFLENRSCTRALARAALRETLFTIFDHRGCRLILSIYRL